MMADAATSQRLSKACRPLLAAWMAAAVILVGGIPEAIAGGRIIDRQPAFVGKWAPTWTSCFKSQDKPDAPLLLTEQGFSQHETHCRFLTLTTAKLGWTARAHCTVESDEQSHVFLFTVKNERLFFTKPHEPRVDMNTYMRCP